MNEGVVQILKSINSPLVFFALTLLITDSTLTIILVNAELTEPHRYAGMWGVFVLWVLLIIIIGLLVWFKPTNLIYRAEHYPKEYGTQSKQVTKKELESKKNVELHK